MLLVAVVALTEVVDAAGSKNATSNAAVSASNKDKRDASLLSKGYPPTQHHQVSVVPSIEVASGSYYETQRNYGTPESHEQQLFYSAENYAAPTSEYASPSVHYAQQQNHQQQSHHHQQQHQSHQSPYLIGTYGPPTAVQFQSNEEQHQGAQSNHAVASVRQLITPAQYTPQGSYSTPPHYNGASAPVQSVQVPSGGYGAPVVGASLSFAGPQSQYQSGAQGLSGFGGFGGAVPGGHSFTASPSPVYGSPFGYGGEQRPQFARQYQQPPQHRFGPSPVKTPNSGYPQSFSGVGSFGKSHVSPFAHQSFRGAGAGPYSHFGGPPSFAHPSRTYGPPPSAQYSSHGPQFYPGYSPSAYQTRPSPSQLIDDGYGTGPSYATGSKGLGHYTAASHASSAYSHPPKTPTLYHRSSANSGPPSKNTFKPSAYLGSSDLSATSQTSTYVLPSTDYAEAASTQGRQTFASPASSPQSYNTIQYSAV